MMLNRNNAVAFYGKRPVLAHQLSGQQIALIQPQHTAGLGKTIGQVYLPGTVGSQLVGGLVDKIADKIGGAIMSWSPDIGGILYAITDFLNWLGEPVGRYMEEMATGCTTYLPTEAAEAVLDYMDKNKLDLIIEALKDTLVAREKRITPYPGASAKSIKEGRDAVLVVLMKFILDSLKVDQNADRLANKVYKVATEAGATDWQAGAAVGYGVAFGLREPGFPKKFSFQMPYTNQQIKLSMGPDSEKLVLSVPGEAKKWLSKLSADVPADLTDEKKLGKWLSDKFEEKSGVKRGDSGGSALPLLAAAAAALFAFRK